MISVLVLTKNEEKMIASCLESAKWADEIILLDNNSQDKTLEIAKKYTDKIFQKKFEGFDKERNFLKDKAKGEWILYIDADERVPVQLKEEIQSAIRHTPYAALAIPRKNIFLGKWLKHGGFWPDHQIRLFKKEKLLGWQGELHEQPKFDGQLDHLKNTLLHLSHRNFDQMIRKTLDWSKIEAKLRFEAGHPKISGWRLARVALTEFFDRLIKRQGFRDGTEGWLEAIYQAFSIFVTYARLWEMQRSQNLEETYKKIDQELMS
jgi:glycosyltransferase involved in cell wall biosynthesis